MIKNIDIEEIAFTTNREQIVQTGTNIFNIDPVSPVFKISREEMKASGAINIKDFIGNLSANNGSGLNLPMALGRDGPWSGSESFGSPISNIGVGHLNLRGLGFGSTLGLINGRRGGITPFTTRYHHDQFFDLNQLPLSMIENVEILTEGASALYGSQAVSGVANIITRKNFDGFELNVDAQKSFDPGVIKQQVDFAIGSSNDERLKINMYGSYSGNTRANIEDFNYFNLYDIAQWSNTGNISWYGATLNGAELGGRTVFPDHYCANGESGRQVEEDVYNNGLKICSHNYFSGLPIIPEESNIKLFAEAELNFTNNLIGFMEINHCSNNNLRSRGAYSDTLFTPLPKNHPFNFYYNDNDQLVRKDPTKWVDDINTIDIDYRGRIQGENSGKKRDDTETDTSYTRVLTGIKGDLSEQWTIEATHMYSYSKNNSLQSHFNSDHRNPPANESSSVPFINKIVNDGSYNPFGTNYANPTLVSPKDGKSVAANSEYVINSLMVSDSNLTKAAQKVLELKLVGNIENIDVVFGIQRRSESFDFIPDQKSYSNDPIQQIPSRGIHGVQKVDSLFVEGIGHITDSVKVQGAVRYEDYKTGNITVPNIGVSWKGDNLSIHSSWGKSFHLPNSKLMSKWQWLQENVPDHSFITNGNCPNGSGSTPAKLFFNKIDTNDDGSIGLDEIKPDGSNDFYDRQLLTDDIKSFTNNNGNSIDITDLTSYRLKGANYSNIIVNNTGDTLVPATSNSFKFGFKSDINDSLRVSVDYWNFHNDNLFEINDSVSSIVNSVCEVDNVTGEYTGNVGRLNPLNDPRISRNKEDGTLNSISHSEMTNGGSIKTAGFDLSIDYSLKSLGIFDSLDFRLNTTYTNKFEMDSVQANLSKFEYVGVRKPSAGSSISKFFDGFSTIPKWKGNLDITVKKGKHSLSSQLRYIDSFKDNPAIAPQSNDGDGAVDLKDINKFITLDSHYSLDLDDNGFRFLIGVKNLLDENALINQDFADNRHDGLILYPNILGRTVYMSLNKTFTF